MEAVNIEQPPAAVVRTLIDVAYAPGTRHISESGYDGKGLVEMSPDGLTMVTTFWDNTKTNIMVIVWDSKSGEMLNRFKTTFLAYLPWRSCLIARTLP